MRTEHTPKGETRSARAKPESLGARYNNLRDRGWQEHPPGMEVHGNRATYTLVAANPEWQCANTA